MRWVLAWSMMIGFIIAGQTAQARVIGKHADFVASVPEGFSCADSITVNIRAASRNAFADKASELSKMVGLVRVVMGLECPQAKTITFDGYHGNQKVTTATISAASNWRLARFNGVSGEPTGAGNVQPASGAFQSAASASRNSFFEQNTTSGRCTTLTNWILQFLLEDGRSVSDYAPTADERRNAFNIMMAHGFLDEIFKPVFGVTYKTMSQGQRRLVADSLKKCSNVSSHLREHLSIPFDDRLRKTSSYRVWQQYIRLARKNRITYGGMKLDLARKSIEARLSKWRKRGPNKYGKGILLKQGKGYNLYAYDQPTDIGVDNNGCALHYKTQKRSMVSYVIIHEPDPKFVFSRAHLQRVIDGFDFSSDMRSRCPNSGASDTLYPHITLYIEGLQLHSHNVKYQHYSFADGPNFRELPFLRFSLSNRNTRNQFVLGSIHYSGGTSYSSDKEVEDFLSVESYNAYHARGRVRLSTLRETERNLAACMKKIPQKLHRIYKEIGGQFAYLHCGKFELTGFVKPKTTERIKWWLHNRSDLIFAYLNANANVCKTRMPYGAKIIEIETTITRQQGFSAPETTNLGVTYRLLVDSSMTGMFWPFIKAREGLLVGRAVFSEVMIDPFAQTRRYYSQYKKLLSAIQCGGSIHKHLQDNLLALHAMK